MSGRCISNIFPGDTSFCTGRHLIDPTESTHVMWGLPGRVFNLSSCIFNHQYFASNQTLRAMMGKWIYNISKRERKVFKD